MGSRIFVFGSNLAGRHGKGAALHARQHYGAVYGQGEGIQGDSFAIPTKDAQLRTLPLDTIAEHVAKFIDYASEHSGLTFEVTRDRLRARRLHRCADRADVCGRSGELRFARGVARVIRHGVAPFLECSSRGALRFSAFGAFVVRYGGTIEIDLSGDETFRGRVNRVGLARSEGAARGQSGRMRSVVFPSLGPVYLREPPPA
ncbi:A1S_2505 family phage non-structural protein [Bradyrhizobium oligotrophicum S58]